MKLLLINNLDFAKNQDEMSQEIDVKNCERLLDLLDVGQQSPKIIRYTLTGVSSQFHLPSLALHVEATLPVL